MPLARLATLLGITRTNAAPPSTVPTRAPGSAHGGAPDTFSRGPRAPHLDRGNGAVTALPAIGRPRPARTGPIGVISDLDQTLIPAHHGPVAPPPFPGVVKLYEAISRPSEGPAGKVYYVTARTEDRARGIPAYLARHNCPIGSVETGNGPDRTAATRGKLEDIAAIMRANPNMRFVLFGDSSHVDADVYRAAARMFPGRVVATFIHRVTDEIDPARVAGMNVIDDYAAAAKKLQALGVIDAETARAVGGEVAAAR